MSREHWISAPEVADRTDGKIVVGDMALPSGVYAEWFEFNVSRLMRGVIGWGGYDSLTLAGYRGDEDKIEVGVGSTDANGNASAASAVSVTKAQTAESDSDSDRRLNARDIRNGNLSIKWNNNSLDSNLPLDQQIDPYIKANQINTEVRNEAIKSVWNHNTKELIKDKGSLTCFDLSLDAFAYSVSGFMGDIINHDYNQALVVLGARAIIVTGFLRVAKPLLLDQVVVKRPMNYKDTIDDSFLYSIRPTRSAIATGVLATKRLVRVAGQD